MRQNQGIESEMGVDPCSVRPNDTFFLFWPIIGGVAQIQGHRKKFLWAWGVEAQWLGFTINMGVC